MPVPGDDVTGGIACSGGGIFVVLRVGRIVDDTDGQDIVVVHAAVGIGQDDREVLEDRVVAVTGGVILVVLQGVLVADHPGVGVVVVHVQGVARRRLEGVGGELVVGDEGLAADGQAGDAVGRVDGEGAALGGGLGLIRAVGFTGSAGCIEVVLVDDDITAFTLRGKATMPGSLSRSMVSVVVLASPSPSMTV